MSSFSGSGAGMLVDHDLARWMRPRFISGGQPSLPRELAPLGQPLPYQRALGEGPATVAGRGRSWSGVGWTVEFGAGGLGDMLLALALVRGLHQVFGASGGLRYVGPRPELLLRSDLPISAEESREKHSVSTTDAGAERVVWCAEPERDPTWLESLDSGMVRVYAALPLRYWLWLEQSIGMLIPSEHEFLPSFQSARESRPFHVVLVTATSWPERKDYGLARYLEIAECLRERRAASWSFTVITGGEGGAPEKARGVALLPNCPASQCVDVFASAELVLGNDTGLVHLAALSKRPDGTRPQVVGLYGRHAYNKWTTARSNHHAIATPFSQMLAHADRCPVRDRLDDSLWGAAADLSEIPPQWIADVVGRHMGWWP